MHGAANSKNVLTTSSSSLAFPELEEHPHHIRSRGYSGHVRHGGEPRASGGKGAGDGAGWGSVLAAALQVPRPSPRALPRLCRPPCQLHPRRPLRCLFGHGHRLAHLLWAPRQLDGHLEGLVVDVAVDRLVEGELGVGAGSARSICALSCKSAFRLPVMATASSNSEPSTERASRCGTRFGGVIAPTPAGTRGSCSPARRALSARGRRPPTRPLPPTPPPSRR